MERPVAIDLRMPSDLAMIVLASFFIGARSHTSTQAFQRSRPLRSAAVDATAQVIVALGLDAKQSDQHQLPPIVDAIEANLGKRPTRLSADAGLLRRQTLRRWRNVRSTPISRRDGPSTQGKERAAARASSP